VSCEGVPFVEIRGYLFGFFVAEPLSEPPRVHVKGKGGSAKFWLGPVRLVRSTYTRNVTREVGRIVEKNEMMFVTMWERRVGGQ